MKIVHLCLSAFYIDNYSYQENMLPKYHVKMGYDVTVIASLQTFNKQGKPDFLEKGSTYEDANGYKVIRLDYIKPLKIGRLLRKYQELRKYLEEEKPDIVFSHNVSYADAAIVADYLKAHPNVKCFADNHADYINSAHGYISRNILHGILWKHYAKVLEPYVTRFYGVTPMRCRFLKEMYNLPEKKIDFLPMGVDDESIPADRQRVKADIRKELGIHENAQVIVTGGKIDKLKNTHILLSALKKIGNDRLHLIICGTLTPEMQYLDEQINDNPNIHYLGWCDAKRVMDCMVASDIACFPGTHSTLWEQSVGVGLPAIFKRWNEMEHVNINDNCILIEGENEQALIDAIQKVLANYSIFKEKAIIASLSFLYSNIAKKAIK